MLWLLAWVPHAVAHGLNPFFSNAMYVPTGLNLGQNTASPLLGLITAPLAPVASPLVRANLMTVLAMPASATAGFVVLRKWDVWWPAAALGGLIYGFSPFLIGHSLGHLSLIFMPVPPFIALTVASVFRQMGSPRRRGVQLGLLLCAQYLISPEVLTSVAVLIVAAVACVMIRRPAKAPEMLRAAWYPVGIALGHHGGVAGLSHLDDACRAAAYCGTNIFDRESLPQRPVELCGPGTIAEGVMGNAVARSQAGRRERGD